MRLQLIGVLGSWKRSLLVMALCVWTVGIQPLPVNASSSQLKKRPFDPLIIKFCVNQLLYEDTFSNGTPSGDRTIIDPASAANACKGVSTKNEALEIKRCVNGLLYESVFRDGSPSGDRTIFDPRSAAEACQVWPDDV